MNPSQATALRDVLADRIVREADATRKVLSALPADQLEFKPHPDSMTARELAWHIVESELLLLDGAARGSLTVAAGRPEPPKTADAMLAAYASRAPEALAAVRALSGAQLATPIAFRGTTAPLVAHLLYVLGHTAHHRGQLTTYLRVMGAPVPGVYGRSRDERTTP